MFSQENPKNIGLTKPQPTITLPVTKGAYQESVRKIKTEPRTQLLKVKDNEYIISNGWEMIEALNVNKNGKEISEDINTKKWYNATVPGTVLTTLVDQGVYPDPYFGLNNLAIPDSLSRMDWWYRTSFSRPQKSMGKKVWLLLNGINYTSNVWLNGTHLGDVKGAFIRGEYDITALLQDTNHLAIHILPPPHPGIPHESSSLSPRGPNGGQLCQDGPTFISSEGWDWMPGIRDRNIGIWQDVRLKTTGAARIIDPQVITDLPLPDTSFARINIKTEIECFVPDDYIMEIELDGKQLSKKLKLVSGKQEIILTPSDFRNLKMKDPELWWPNGYGDQNLYSIKMTLRNSKSGLEDRKTVRFGVRELSYEFAVSDKDVDFQRIDFNPIDAFTIKEEALFDPLNHVAYKSDIVLPTLHQGVELNMFDKLEGDNPYLVIKVNGQPIFCKGGNWGMDDAMKRVSRERLEPYFKLHKDANYTMIRNWTGESTEEVFYELADEYGLLVWNDFWMSTEGYNMPPADFGLFMTNATDVVKRFRNHPSIAIWCARNEGYAPKGLDKSLADLVAKEDGTRLYQSNSRYLNLRPSGPWNYIHDYSYLFKEHADGFSTEIGTQSFPTAESMKTMMAEEDLWPISEVWYYHDLHTGHQDYRAALIDDYAEAFSLEDYSKKAQMLNYVSHRGIFEAWNSRLWDDASGVLLWMTHPAWPSMIWQTYSWDYETYGAYYGAKKGCEPIHIQRNTNDGKVLVINTTLNEYKGLTASATAIDGSGSTLFEHKTNIGVNQNSKKDCFFFNIPDSFKLPEVYYIKLELTDRSGKMIADNFYWETINNNHKYYDFNIMDQVVVKAEGNHQISNGKLSGSIKVKNPSEAIALALKLNLRNSATNERILPAYFSDGYFSLLPGEEKVLFFECDKADLPDDLKITAEGYNVDSQTLIAW
ncbi:glycoside hydrolase family 2 [Maribacter sp. ANRC-HE7]|uniref:Glycoside hydrolase family 2 n=2 Tax=Maribacter aquimaris TaxID=2737171 RepID=A0ABR7V4A5_9FLAO|nr:glycoside hydrolase family 2 [Maribacter aquimaris]